MKRAFRNVAAAGALLAIGALVTWTFAVTSGARTAPSSTTAVAPSLITAPVEERVLEETFAVRGSVEEQSTELVVAPDPGDVAGVVTALFVREGDTVGAGTVVASVADRPVIVLPGEVPMYRSLGREDTGPDVARLQEALALLDLYKGPIDGHFGWLTERAVRDLYDQAGFPPPTAGASGEVQEEGATQSLRVPLGELVFVSELPATVAAVRVSLGDVVSAGDPILGLGSGSALIIAEVPVDRTELLPVGTPASFFSEVLQVGGEGRVVSVSETTRVSAQGIHIREVTVEPTGDIPSDLFGADVAVTFTVTLSDGPVVAVPITAIHALPDGRIFVTKVEADDDQTEIEVTVGAVIGGFVEITSGNLTPGDRVVVGSSR